MKTKISINDFKFAFLGKGHYLVTYESPKTGKKWSAITSNMPLIDATKNEEEPKRKNLEELRKLCKSKEMNY